MIHSWDVQHSEQQDRKDQNENSEIVHQRSQPERLSAGLRTFQWQRKTNKSDNLETVLRK